MQLTRLIPRGGSALFNSLIVMGGYLLSRVTGLLRDIIITRTFGTSAEIGAYYAAFRVTDMLYMIIIGGALGSSFIPVFIQIWQRDGAERAWHLASAVVTWALTILTVASMLLWLLAPQVTAWFFPGTPAEMALTAQLIRLFLLSPLLLGLGGLAMAALNAHDRFTLPALAPAIYNIGIISGALLLAPTMGIWGLAWGVIIGAALYLLIQLPALFWGLHMRLRPSFGRAVPEIRTIGLQMTPRVFGQAAAQISLLITAILTVRLEFGRERLAGLQYAYQLMLLPYGVFSLSLSTVAFPRLARLFSEGQIDELQASVRQTLSTILFLTLPAAVALIVLAVPLVRVLFQRAEFDEISLVYTFVPLLGYATALPAFAAAEILIRSFYAMQRTWIPVLLGILQVSLNLALGSLALTLGYGVGMLALAFSVANTTEAVLLALLLGRSLPGIWRDWYLWRSLAAATLASLILGGGLWLLRWLSLPLLPYLQAGATYEWQQDLLPLLAWLVVVGGVGVLLYIGTTTVLGSGEARALWRRLRRTSSPD